MDKDLSEKSFIALDFETATEEKFSICEIGICIVEEGTVIDTKSWLVQPPGNKYRKRNTDIHGINNSKTKNSPLFPEVWKEVLPLIDNKIIVAHNAGFDMSVLRGTLEYYKLDEPNLTYYCSLETSKRAGYSVGDYSLSTLYKEIVEEDMEGHHRAGNDATACAKIFLNCIDILLTKDENFSKYLKKSFKDISLSKLDGNSRPTTSKFKRDIEIPEISDPSLIDKDSPLFGKNICFTGECFFAERKDLYQWVVNLGGHPVKNVTKKTDILIVGKQTSDLVKGGKSSKHKKALELKDSGQKIEILSEDDLFNIWELSNNIQEVSTTNINTPPKVRHKDNSTGCIIWFFLIAFILWIVLFKFVF